VAEFLDLVPPSLALQRLLEALRPPAPLTERCLTSQAAGRTLGEDVFSPEDLPSFSRSMMDGYAVHARDTFGASDSLPAYLILGPDTPMGRAPCFSLPAGQASLIHTGGMLPEGADAVIMMENTQATGSGELEVLRPVGVSENILKVGEDLRSGQQVFFAGRRLRPADIGSLMALGITEILAAVPPRVAVLSSGDEVVPPDCKPTPGQVRDINSYSLGSLITQSGGVPVFYGIIPDHHDALFGVLQKALQECDAIVITAGSSASARDLTAGVIGEMGQPGVLVHGVSVRPGKPTILAACKGKAIIGLPGNPVSAMVIARLFVTPWIDRLLGVAALRVKPSVTATLRINTPSQAGREDWIPAHLIQTGSGLEVEPIFYKSNLIFTLAQADGLIYIPADITGYSAGEIVQVEFL